MANSGIKQHLRLCKGCKLCRYIKDSQPLKVVILSCNFQWLLVMDFLTYDLVVISESTIEFLRSLGTKSVNY